MNILPYSGFPALPKNIEDMHNQLVTLGLNDVEALTARIKKCEDWVDNVEETELTGNPVEFQNALAVPATSLETTINAIQDLHGYDHSWAGGAGKNKLPITTARVKENNVSEAKVWTGNRCTMYGMTFDLVEDNAGNLIEIVANGTPTQEAQFYLTPPLTIAESTILTGCPATGSDNTYMLYATNSGGGEYGSGLNIAANTSHSYMIIVRANVAMSNKSFKPMLRLSTETDATFAPYSNICPISGRTAVTVTRSDGDEISEDFTIQLGTTVYGADINWDTGVMTVDKKYGTLPTTGWTHDNSWTEPSAFAQNNIFSDIKPVEGFSTVADIISDILRAERPSRIVSSTYDTIGIGVGNGNNKTIYINLGAEYNTAEKVATYLTNNPVGVCYELATPTTIQLTPTQLAMLKGYNRVSIEDGTITITAYTGGPWEPITRATKKKAKTKKSKKGGN